MKEDMQARNKQLKDKSDLIFVNTLFKKFKQSLEDLNKNLQVYDEATKIEAKIFEKKKKIIEMESAAKSLEIESKISF